MDIFKLGDKILALLEAVFGFWNNQISLMWGGQLRPCRA